MTRELVSKRTRNEFREFLVGWTLREIEIEFEGANIECDSNFEPDVSGARRSFVEQYYRTLDHTKPADVKRLLDAYQNIIERAERNLPPSYGREEAERAIEQLKVCLERDGFTYLFSCRRRPQATEAQEGIRWLEERPKRLRPPSLGNAASLLLPHMVDELPMFIAPMALPVNVEARLVAVRWAAYG